MTVIEKVTLLDLRVEEAREAYKSLGGCIESLEYSAPEDTAKTAMVLRQVAQTLNRIATALCIQKPEGDRS